ncbi:MAG: hypothetical protein IT530_15200 [Burkholderiales bacterium]|nr:hypothetical protein [Burkholderiales bacterium]
MQLPAGRFANLIVASTFYHVILACLIARDVRFAGASVLVLHMGREQMAALYESLARSTDSPFAATVAMHPGEGGKAARERAQGRWLARLDRIVQSERVIVFNDLTPDLQLLCRRAEQRGARTFCGEDGGAAYSSRSAASPRRRHLQRMLRFGPWIENVVASGASRHIQTYLALNAELLRPELQHKPVWALQARAMPELIASSWIGEFLARFGVAPSALACDELYVPARNRPSAARERACSALSRELHAARQAGLDCLVKYHPRDPQDRLGAQALGVRVLPAAIPAELIYLASGERLRRVLGDTGTTLMSARWLAPQAQAISALELSAMDDPWYARTLERLGVQSLHIQA